MSCAARTSTCPGSRRDRYDVLDELHGGLQLVQAPVTRLPVPVASEIVLEGYLSLPSATVAEGPYREFLGYYVGGTMQTPTL